MLICVCQQHVTYKHVLWVQACFITTVYYFMIQPMTIMCQCHSTVMSFGKTGTSKWW